MKIALTSIITILLSTLFSLSSFAQQQNDRQLVFRKYEEKYNILDTAKMEVFYIHSMSDPILNKKDIVYETLVIGENHSRYLPYLTYLEDSIANSRAGEKYWEMENWKEHRQRNNMYGYSFERVNKNFKDSTLRFTGNIIGDMYYYDEPLHPMEWTIGDETKEVLGHQCQKATTTWRGRKWTAWFSDIPYSDGPWKFGGLPGLILEMSDSTGQHKIRVKEIKHEIFPLGTWNKNSMFKSKRERYKEMLEKVVEDLHGALIGSGRVKESPEEKAKPRKPRRMFYCPIELE